MPTRRFALRCASRHTGGCAASSPRQIHLVAPLSRAHAAYCPAPARPAAGPAVVLRPPWAQSADTGVQRQAHREGGAARLGFQLDIAAMLADDVEADRQP